MQQRAGHVARVLDHTVVETLDQYAQARGGEALRAARVAGPVATLETIETSGLRGRGGAGFPTGTKWRTVAGMGGGEPATVVVNAAEGEPGTLKDRTLVRVNPFKILEGALIGANTVGADRVIVGCKSGATQERRRVVAAAAEMEAAGWTEGIAIDIVASSDRYLLGEETGLLEAINGRPPFPRIAPPYRAGAEPAGADPASRAGTNFADAEGATDAAATLVNNVETFANVPRIVLDGPEHFRRDGTEQSPGTMVCTVSGCTERAGVGEFALGTPLRQVIAELGGELPEGDLLAVLSGTANPILPAGAVDAPLSWEGLAAAGGGLGSAGFIVIDDTVDIVSVAHGVSRFLSVESCGQCTPCKQDGRSLTDLLDRARLSQPESTDAATMQRLTSRVTDGARCFLAQQHQLIVQSLLRHFPDALAAHADGRAAPAEPFPVVPLHDIIDGEAVLDLGQLKVAPDWTIGPDSGQSPADRLAVRSRS
jgi:NADH:ubiquinone oxidoreductase subunit F (NADH-binding)